MNFVAVELKQHPEVKAVVLAAFPGYRKLKAYVHEFGSYGHSINSYWDGGSRSEYAIVELATRRTKSLPTSTHPYFDVVRHGGANTESPDVVVDSRGNATLKHLPEGMALVEAGISCGKPATASVFLNPANLTKFLTA